jgi:O-antigen ligase
VGLDTLARIAVFLTIATSGIVFSEPAPVDMLMMGLVILLPLAGLQRCAPGMAMQLLLWLGCGAGALIAASVSREVGDSTVHTLVSFYLYAAFFVLAAFVAVDPDAHGRLVLKAWMLGALVAAIAGLVGYFRLAPGAFELFTRFGRAAGTFKDPNVLGPFLVPAILFIGHRVLYRETRWMVVDLAVAGVLTLAVLLSFSRGAWINLAFAVVLYGAMSLATLASAAARARLAVIVSVGVVLGVATVLAALQVEEVARLLSERAALTQGYDVGPEGRFGGQEKAIGLALANPLGIGAKQFSLHYHPEDVHNVFISMFLNAGWLGGLLYFAAVATTLVAGLAHLAEGTATRPLFLIAYAAFAANVVEGLVIDTDHWRHFYILLALIWGFIGADHQPPARLRQ